MEEWSCHLPFTKMGKTMGGAGLASHGNWDIGFDHSKFEKPGRDTEWVVGYSLLWLRGETMLKLSVGECIDSVFYEMT